MKKWLLITGLASGIALGVVALLVASKPAPVSAGVATQLHVELVVPAAPGKGAGAFRVAPIPPNGSGWHELFPAFCTTYTQDDYTDNGDGIVSACDIIKLSGVDYHIVWAGPTYWTTCETPGVPPTTVVYEPTQPTSGGNPICEIWHEIWPNFCGQIHIEDWQDNGDGTLSPCDFVFSHLPNGAPVSYHIDRIECDITIEPVTTPVEPSTWGKVKALFQGLFQ